MRKNIFEQEIKVSVEDGNVKINGNIFKLVIETLVGLVKVKIENLIKNNDGTWTITASLGPKNVTNIIKKEAVNKILNRLSDKEIELGGKPNKKLIKLNENTMQKVVKLTEKDISNLVKKVLKEQEEANYMFFSNLRQMKRQIEIMLKMDETMIDTILMKGHDWADDHITEAKTNLDQVFDFLMNEQNKNEDSLEYEDINESRKKKGSKLCARGIAAAKVKYDVYPSAYANGYAVQVCKGKKPGTDGKKMCSGSYC